MACFLAMSKWQYALALLITVACVLAVNLSLTRQSVQAFRLGDYTEYPCATGSDQQAALRVYLAAPLFIQSIANYLCHSEVIARQFGSVVLSWKPRESITAADLLEGEYTLLMGRQHSFTGLVPNFSELYHPLHTAMEQAEYKVYWYSKMPISTLQAEYFRGKRVGLIDDKVSHTHYLIPLTSLARLGVHLDEIELHYYQNAFQLYNGFENGEVDFISSGQWLPDNLDQQVFQTLITADASLGNLYIRNATASPVQCELARALEPFSQYVLAVLGGNSADPLPRTEKCL